MDAKPQSNNHHQQTNTQFKSTALLPWLGFGFCCLGLKPWWLGFGLSLGQTVITLRIFQLNYSIT